MDNFYFNPHIQDFARTDPEASEADLRQKYNFQRVFQLANNENPLGPSPHVIEAIQAVAPTLSYYPDYSDIELRRAIVAVLGRGLTPAHIYTGCSGFEALELIARGFLSSGDEMILSSPTFAGAYTKVSRPLGAKIIDVPLAPETFEYRVEAVLAAVNDRDQADHALQSQ